MFFTIPETEEEFYYSYLPEIIKEKKIVLQTSEQHFYYFYENNQTSSTSSMMLSSKSNDDKYFIVELSQTISDKNIIINFSAEDDTKYRTYKNSSDIIISDITHIQGKDRIILQFENKKQTMLP